MMKRNRWSILMKPTSSCLPKPESHCLCNQVARNVMIQSMNANFTANLFMFFEASGNRRHVKVTEQRTKIDFAHCMKDLVDEIYPDAEIIHVVLDDLNTHKLSSLYEAFPAEEAHRIARKLQFHYTPKHGSWLNMAEIELSILSRQCLSRRIADKEFLIKEVDAWQTERNHSGATIDWQFTTKDARIKLKRLYPSFHN